MSRDTRILDAAGRPLPTAAERAMGSARTEALQNFFGGGGYAGARGSKRALKEWFPGSHSADSDSIPDLETLRGRSRDLERNDPLATGAINTVCTNVVGTGLRLVPNVDWEFLGIAKEEAQRWAMRASRIYKHWCKHADFSGAQHFDAMQELILRSELLSGDNLVVRRMRAQPGVLLDTRVQVIEADRIATPDDQNANPRIVEGVERDGDGNPVRYHIRSRHRRDFSTLGVRLSGVATFSTVEARDATGARNALLVMERRRPDQTRGVPYLAPVIEPLKQLGRYTEAELMAAVIQSFFTVFVKSDAGDGLANTTNDDTITSTTGKAIRDAPELNLGHGIVLNLDPGESIENADPSRPNTSFDPFVQAVLRQVGVALEIPFELIVKHFTASYSAARAALLEAWRFFRRRRHHLVHQLMAPTYEWVISEAVATGVLRARRYFEDPLAREAWLRADWVGPSMGQVDPVKETKAAQMRIEMGASTHSEVTAELTGGDWREKHPKLAEEKAMRREDGLEGAADATGAAAEAPAPAPDDDAPPQNPDLPEEPDAA